MKKVYAVWEGKRTRSYITLGKKYEVFPNKFADFDIINEDGDRIDCMWKNCVRLDYKNWTRIEEDYEAPQTELIPVPAPEPEPYQKTLRDEFAMAALIGVVAIKSPLQYKDYAEFSYKMADAMLEARKK